jgi:hypothetical protein
VSCRAGDLLFIPSLMMVGPLRCLAPLHTIAYASKVRSTDALLIHCWGKLAVAFFLLGFNY